MKWMLATFLVWTLVGCTDVTPEVKQLRFPRAAAERSKSFISLYAGANSTAVATGGGSSVYNVQIYVHDGQKPTMKTTQDGAYTVGNPQFSY